MTVMGYWVPFIYRAVLAGAAGSVRLGLFAEAATSPKACHTSALCPLSCSLTALVADGALIQWGFGVGLFVLFIMHQSRKQQKQKLS